METSFSNINEASSACDRIKDCFGFVYFDKKYHLRGTSVVKPRSGMMAWLKKDAPQMEDNSNYRGPDTESMRNCEDPPDSLFTGAYRNISEIWNIKSPPPVFITKFRDKDYEFCVKISTETLPQSIEICISRKFQDISENRSQSQKIPGFRVFQISDFWDKNLNIREKFHPDATSDSPFYVKYHMKI